MASVVVKGIRRELTLLAAADLHHHDPNVLTDAVRHFAPDVVVFAGDGLSNCVARAGRSWLPDLAELASVGVLAVAGNADGRDALVKYGGAKVYDLARQPVDVGPVRFIGLEGAPLIRGLLPDGLGNPLYSERDASHYLNRCVREHPGPVVLVSHAPPRGLLDRSIRLDRNVGSIAVRELIASRSNDLRLILSGHVHSQGGRSCTVDTCTVYNVASFQAYEGVVTICYLRLNPLAAGVLFVEPASPFGASLRWTRMGELGFLSGMQRPVAEKLIAGGVTRLDELASLSGEHVAKHIGWAPAKASVWSFRAQAVVQRRPIPVGPLGMPDAPRWYIDIETDPWGGRECVWAVALASHETGEITQWYLTHRSGHRGMLRAIAVALSQLPERKLIAYSGSRFDERVLSEHMRRHGIAVPPALDTAIDLHPAIARSVALPGTGQLKDVLRAFSIVHRDGDLDGMEAASRAMSALRRNQPIPRRVLRYNREDVRTLRALTIAVSDLVGTTAPLPRRSRPSGGAVRRRQDDQRVVELLTSHGLTLAALAKANPWILGRMQSGRRISSLDVEVAIRRLGTGSR